MVYLPTFSITIHQMQVNIPYMDGMGIAFSMASRILDLLIYHYPTIHVANKEPSVALGIVALRCSAIQDYKDQHESVEELCHQAGTCWLS